MMTPEEIQQVVEDYRKSSQSLNENIFSDKAQQFLRNLGRQDKDKVIKNNNKNNNNGAQGATNGAQGAQSSTTGSQGAQSNDNVGAQGNGAQSSTTGAQGAQSNDNVGAQGNGAQSSTVTGAQGAQSSTVTGAQGAQGGQSTPENTVKKNEIDQYIRKGKEVTIKDFGGISGAQGAQTKISPATYSTNQRQTRELVSTGKLKDTDLNKYSRSNTYTADDGKTQVTRSTVNTIAQFDMGPYIKKGDKLGVISNKLRKQYDLKAADFKPEAYDLVLDYVLSEGHADSVEEAHYVMMQMDEETIQTIIKENPLIKTALVGLGGYMGYKGLKKAGDSFNNMLNNLRNNSKIGGNKRVDDTRKNSGDPNVGQKFNFGAQGNKP